MIRLLRLLTPLLAALVLLGQTHGQSLQKVTINYPTRSGASWPLYIAKEGGYYQKYGLDVDLQFGVHPTGIAMLTSNQAVMVNHSLEQAMVASARDASFSLVGSPSNRGIFALMAQKTFTSPKELKGKRIAIGQIGDAFYNYTVALLGKYGPQFIPLVVSVRNGHLYATVENEYDYRLTPLNRVTFALPPGMYSDEQVVFQLDPAGKCTGAIMANQYLPRSAE